MKTRGKGTKLKVFSGKEATLNRVILLILRSRKLLTRYDLFLELKGLKGFRHTDSKTVYRRVKALDEEGWIKQNGTRPAKVQGDSILYEISIKGKVALKLNEKSIEVLLKTATDQELTKLLDLLEL